MTIGTFSLKFAMQRYIKKLNNPIRQADKYAY